MSYDRERFATHLCEKCGRTSSDPLTHNRDADEYWCDFCIENTPVATPAVGAEDDYAFRFQYADGSAFQIYADGRAYIMAKDGSIRDKPKGVIINRIPLLIGYAAKPRQDRIEELEAQPAASPASPLRGRESVREIAHRHCTCTCKNDSKVMQGHTNLCDEIADAILEYAALSASPPEHPDE